MSPGTAVTGFPPGIVSNGTVYTAAGAAGAQADLTTAYNDAAGRTPPAAVSAFIGAGQSLSPGVYKASSSLDCCRCRPALRPGSSPRWSGSMRPC